MIRRIRSLIPLALAILSFLHVLITQSTSRMYQKGARDAQAEALKWARSAELLAWQLHRQTPPVTGFIDSIDRLTRDRDRWMRAYYLLRFSSLTTTCSVVDWPLDSPQQRKDIFIP